MLPSTFATSPEEFDGNLLSVGKAADDLFVPVSTGSLSSYRSSSDMFSTSNSSRPLSLFNSRTNSSESFDPDNYQAFDFDLGSTEYNEMSSAFGDSWFDVTSPTSPQFSSAGNSVQQYVTSPNFVEEGSGQSAASELESIPEFGQYPPSNGGRESSSNSPPNLATPVQNPVDHRHAPQTYLLEQLGDSHNSLDRWSSNGGSEFEMLTSADRNYTTSSHTRNLSDGSVDTGFPPGHVESLLANDSANLEMGMQLGLVNLGTISPEYIHMARRYDWL
jgi:hypothetical protein